MIGAISLSDFMLWKQILSRLKIGGKSTASAFAEHWVKPLHLHGNSDMICGAKFLEEYSWLFRLIY
jgi:hypothetical protein